MLMHILSSSLLIACVLLVRVLFRGKVPYRLLYLLWIPVFLRLMIPGTVYDFTVLQPEEQTAFHSAIEWLADDVVTPAEPGTPSEDSTAPAPQPSSDVSFQTILLSFYLIGCIAVGGRFCILSLSVWRKLNRSRTFLYQYRGIRVYKTDCTFAPCVHGLIPAVYLTNDVSAQMNLILEHEYTHIKHLDFLRLALRRLSAVLYWWNPLVWFYVRFAAEDAELACDESVAARLDQTKRLQYANAIYALLPQNRKSSLGFVGKPLKRRLVALTSRHTTRASVSVLAAVLVAAVSVMSTCGLTAVQRTPDPPDGFSDGEWCSELFPPDFPVPFYNEIYEIKQDGDSVTVTLFCEPGPVSDYLPSHNLRARLIKCGYINFYDFETRREYFLNKEGYNVTINDNLRAGWLDEIHKQNPYGYTYQIKLEKIEHTFESVFWEYPYKNKDLGLEPITFDGYPTDALPVQLPAPPESLTLRLTHAEQQKNGVYLRYEGDLYDFWRYNRMISDAGFYFIETGGGDFFFVNAQGDYLYARIVSMSNSERGHDVFEYQICKHNSLIKK